MSAFRRHAVAAVLVGPAGLAACGTTPVPAITTPMPTTTGTPAP